MTKADVRATLSAVVADPRSLAYDPERIVVFDSTGVAIEDVAAAALVFKRAVAAGAGLEVTL
jgi:ornithine cyclodeaminase/alanine dehydrogenase-like protein (mu-crystallin family)